MTVGRILLGTFVALIVLLVLWSWQLMRPGPPIRLSKQTTYITEPLADDGLPDYVAYLDAKYSEGVTPENNATVLLVQASGLRYVSDEMRDEWLMRLGMENLPVDGDYFGELDDESAIIDSADWLIAYWRSQRDGTEPPTTMTGLSQYNYPLDSSGMVGQGAASWHQEANGSAWSLASKVLQRPWTSTQVPPVAARVDANADLLDMVVEASERQRMYAPLMTGDTNNTSQLYGVLLPTMQDLRMLCRGLQARTMLNLGDGRYAEARTDIFATHRLARLSGEGPFLVHYLVAIALDGMACEQQIALASQPNAPADLFEASLDEIRELGHWQRAADRVDQVERLATLDAVLSLRRNPDALDDWDLPNGQIMSRLLRSNIDWNIVLERINGYYDDLVTAMQSPDRGERDQAFIAVNARSGGFSDGLTSRLAEAALSRSSRSELIADVLAGLLIPAVQRVTVAEERANVQLDLATTALALAVHRARHGAYPESLDALAPDILDAVPLDRFTKTDCFPNSPFHYERRGQGYLLYSVGMNGIDDGGTDQGGEIVKGEWIGNDDWAEAPDADQSDLVIRVPLPALVIPTLPDDVTLPPRNVESGIENETEPSDG